MPEREFDHLPYDLYFPAKAANIFVVGFVVSFFTPSGISENSTEVFLVMMTASSGSISTILNTTIWGWRYGSTSMIGTESFFATGKSIRPAIILGLFAIGLFGQILGGARTTPVAAISSMILVIVTGSPIATPAFWPVKLSIRILRWFPSSTSYRQTLAIVLRFHR